MEQNRSPSLESLKSKVEFLKPFSFTIIHSGFLSCTVGFMFEGQIISTYKGTLNDCKSIVDSLNGAYNLGYQAGKSNE